MTSVLGSLVIAVCALSFTVASFWWLNARRGHLKTFEPHTFAFANTPHLVRLRLPLVLYNTGATPIIVQDLRACIQDEQNSESLLWVGTRSQIKPDSEDGHAFPSVFSIAGRAACQIFAEFGAPSLGFTLEAREYMIRIDVKLSHKDGWRSLITFPLQSSQIADPNSFITYRNTPRSLQGSAKVIRRWY